MSTHIQVIGSKENETVEKTSEIRSVFANRREEEIWRLFVGGDNKAFIFLYDRYFNLLFRYGRQFTADKDLIKDTIQDIFVEFRTRKYKVSQTTSISFYLFKCLKNKLVDKLQKHERFVSLEQHGFNFDFTISPEQKIIDIQFKEELIEKLNSAIKKLTARQREAVYYLFYQNFSIDEIKELMRLDSRRSVQNLVYKAIAYLKECF